MATNTKPELAVLISTKEDRGIANDPYLHIQAAVVQIEDGNIRNLSTSSWDRHPAAQLQTSTYVYRTTGMHWDVEYRDLYSVELGDLERMVKYLRTVTKKLDRMRDERGYSETFAEHVTRLAEAVGAKTFVWKTDPSARGGWSYDDDNYRRVGADIARSHINNLVDTFRKEDSQS
jgi:hypothetical protein